MAAVKPQIPPKIEDLRNLPPDSGEARGTRPPEKATPKVPTPFLPDKG